LYLEKDAGAMDLDEIGADAEEMDVVGRPELSITTTLSMSFVELETAFAHRLGHGHISFW
jgi:hypothetical protein